MSFIANLKHYELVFTTSFEHKHGVSGHLYEMIDYFYIANQQGIKTAILLTDGTTVSMLKKAVIEKYDFSDSELSTMFSNTVEMPQPKIILCNQLCVVDGSPRFNNCTVYAEHVWLMRCSDTNFSYFNKHKTIKQTHLLQDYGLYSERYDYLDDIDYVKKILWSKYKQPTTTKDDIGLLYLTTNCRGLEPERIKEVLDKNICPGYLIVTNDVSKYKILESENVEIALAPVSNIFDKFGTYIYTPIPRQFDCSPRFIVECKVFGKKVVYELDYVDSGIERRKQLMEQSLDGLLLTEDDAFLELIKHDYAMENN
jgi:hypothetical protein